MNDKTILSDKHKQSISVALSGRTKTPEHKKKIAEGMKLYRQKQQGKVGQYK